VQVGRLLALLNGRSAGEIVKSLRLMIKTHAMDAARAKPVERAASYLVKNTPVALRPRAGRWLDATRYRATTRRVSSRSSSMIGDDQCVAAQ
jgi:hypothetical protein